MYIICNYLFTSYSHGELHNLQEFEQTDTNEEKFKDPDIDHSLHRNFEKDDSYDPPTSTRPLLKNRLLGHGQSLDDDTISYYNR